MQTCHACKLKEKCPAGPKHFGEYMVNTCYFFVPRDATILDEKWLLARVKTIYGKQTKT